MAILTTALSVGSMGLKMLGDSGALDKHGEDTTSTYTKTGDFKNAGLYNRTMAGFDEEEHKIATVDKSMSNMANLGSTALGVGASLSQLKQDSGDDGIDSEDTALGTEGESTDVPQDSPPVDTDTSKGKEVFNDLAAIMGEFGKAYMSEEEKAEDERLNFKTNFGTSGSGIYNKQISF